MFDGYDVITPNEYFDDFLKLLANYMSEKDELLEITDIDWLESYIKSTKEKISNESYHFSVGAAWGVTLTSMFNDENILEGELESIADQFTTMVENFTGIKIG